MRQLQKRKEQKEDEYATVAVNVVFCLFTRVHVQKQIRANLKMKE